MSEPPHAKAEGTAVPACHLQLLPTASPEPEEVVLLFVRAVRRDMARLLRGLRGAGRGLSSFPDHVTTRLAHLDAVTLRYLHGPSEAESGEAQRAASAMRALEGYVVGSLPVGDLARVRACELTVRVSEEELRRPLLPSDLGPDGEESDLGPAEPLSLRAGLASLSLDHLAIVARRLGVRTPDLDDHAGAEACEYWRMRTERTVYHTLRDGHLLGILVATLPDEAHRLLGALVRGTLDDHACQRIAAECIAVDLGDECFLTSPARALCLGGLAYCTGTPGQERVWVPVELQRRLDGVLRAFGV